MTKINCLLEAAVWTHFWYMSNFVISILIILRSFRITEIPNLSLQQTSVSTRVNKPYH